MAVFGLQDREWLSVTEFALIESSRPRRSKHSPWINWGPRLRVTSPRKMTTA